MEKSNQVDWGIFAKAAAAETKQPPDSHRPLIPTPPKPVKQQAGRNRPLEEQL